jgi:potassium-transporting ATPase potassium-binding subunit
MTSGKLRTETLLFAIVLIGTAVIVGALTYVPALALGPVIEHLLMVGKG